MVFIPAIYRWWIGEDVHPGHQIFLTTVMGYIFAGKVVNKKSPTRKIVDRMSETQGEK
jgi:hypothetical protein